MQKWIIERKFGRDDEISLHGDHWKRLGDIAELQPFFLLLDEVDRVHLLEERLRRAELPDEAPSALEDELGGAAPRARSDRPAPAPALTPIRLETPIDPRPSPGARQTRTPPPAEASPWPRPPPPSSGTLGPEPKRSGTPSAFSLEEFREATGPRPDDPPMPEGTVEPGLPGPADDPDLPEFTRRAGLGVDPGGVETPTAGTPHPAGARHPGWRRSLAVAAAAGAVAAYFEVWVPAQEEKLRQEAQRARLEESQKARDAADAEVRERERRAKEELVAGMAGRADAGVGSAAPVGARSTPAPVGARRPRPRAGPPSPHPPPPSPPRRRPRPTAAAEPRAHTFDEWMALADRDRDHARIRAALDAYDRAIALDGSRPEAYVGQGRVHLELGDARSAIAAFRRALMVNSRYSVAEFWLGEAYRRVGQSSQAADAYGRYLDAAPEGAEASRAREALNALK